MIYQIRISEQLDEQWAEWFLPLVIHHAATGATTLTGPVRDQAELFGLLIKVRDLNLTLVAVNPIAASGTELINQFTLSQEETDDGTANDRSTPTPQAFSHRQD